MSVFQGATEISLSLFSFSALLVNSLGPHCAVIACALEFLSCSFLLVLSVLQQAVFQSFTEVAEGLGEFGGKVQLVTCRVLLVGIRAAYLHETLLLSG